MLGDVPKLLARPHFVFGVVAQFFYVGAQVGVWSYMIRYAQAEVPGMGEKAAAAVLMGSLWALFAGRFIGAALMSTVAPRTLMALYATANVVLVGVSVAAGGTTGLYALATTSFFMSIMFPTIFATAVKDLGPLTKTGSSFMVMAIIGGAVMTPLIGWISHLSSTRLAMVVPAVCFAVVGLYALSAGRAVA
ncbi:MAG: glucose/galactose MFS transporter, partial [Candidatus Bipolaricaulota bacterium]|nr:glucose/galactose MFS transporter [Candidatus Bipolaricaulota bacterium]